MAFVKRHRTGLAFTVLSLAIILALSAVEERTATQLYQNSLAACERGNVLRSVVYANTANAARQNPNNAGKFAEQLKVLQSVEHTNQKDGTIDCDAANPAP